MRDDESYQGGSAYSAEQVGELETTQISKISQFVLDIRIKETYKEQRRGLS